MKNRKVIEKPQSVNYQEEYQKIIQNLKIPDTSKLEKILITSLDQYKQVYDRDDVLFVFDSADIMAECDEWYCNEDL